MANYFNDSPIESAAADQYGIAPFACALSDSIVGIANPIGTTIAINGAWGSGKSSAVNLIRNELAAKNDARLTVVDFKCWWFRGEEALTLAFFQELNRTFRAGLGDRVKDLMPIIGRQILQAGPVLGTAISLATAPGLGGLVSGSASFLKKFFPEDESLERTFHKLSKELEAQDKRFLVIIDDIDRLSPDEALAIFRLVKSVGRLPNVMYLLVFDRELAEKVVKERYPSEGPHFLEKIIQASFEVPLPISTDLNNAVLAAVENICGSPTEDKIVRFMNVFYDVVAPYLTSPRHVTRLINAMSVTWSPVADEVSHADYLAMETLRLYEPTLYSNIRANREQLTGSASTSLRERRDNARFEPFLRGLSENIHERVIVALQRIFPSLENTSYGGEFSSGWDAERRICVAKHFDTYFRLALSDDALPAADLAEILKRADEPEFITTRFAEAFTSRRKNGKSKVPVLLDEITIHSKRMEKSKVEPFLCSLFQISDFIRRDEDKDQGFPSADAHLRIHWLIRRLTEDRFTLAEKSALYLKATENAALFWLVDFVSSAVDDYHPREGRQPSIEENCLTEETALPVLKRRALTALEAASKDGSLLNLNRPGIAGGCLV